MDTIKFEYNPEWEMSYGSWRCPSCGIIFFGGGGSTAPHRKTCLYASTGYADCIYTIGPKMIADAIEQGATKPGPLHGFTLEQFRAQLPAEVAEIERQMPRA